MLNLFAVRSCKSKLDLGFAIDGCGTDSFSSCTELIKSIIKKVDVSSGETRVGIILYSRRAELLFGFGDLTNVSQISNALNNISYKLKKHRSLLNIGAALEMARQKLFTETRPGTKQVLILVTGGKAKDDVVIPSSQLRKDGVKLYAVGVGGLFDQGQLDVISSNPIYNYKLTSDSPSILDLTRSVRSDLCKGKKIFTSLLNSLFSKHLNIHNRCHHT